MRVAASQDVHHRGRSTPAGGAKTPRGTPQKPRGNVFSELGLVAFFSNSATLLGSGIPLIKTLEALATDETFKNAAPTLEELAHDIRSGSSFSNALSKHSKSFSPMIVSLVRAAEASGTLVDALERIAQDIEQRRESRAQLRKALTYPVLVTVLGTAAIGFLMAFVVPIFEETYAKAKMPLPAITVVLIAMSRVVAKTWWMMMILVVVAALLYRRFGSHPRVESVRDRFLMRSPLVGPMVRTILVGKFAQSFGNLLEAGVPVKESLALTEQVFQHSEFKRIVRELHDAIARGESMGRKLGEYRYIFTPLVTQMITLGEKSGELGKMVVQIGRYIDKDLKRRTQQLSMLIEPIVTVALAFAVGAVALAIYLPIFDMFKQVGQ